MKIIRQLATIPDDEKGSVVVLGNFDGFHKGHQKVIGKAGKIAKEMGTTLSVLSMEPHPRLFFNPNQKEFRLNSFRTKAHLLEEFGVDHFIILPFDQELASMPAQDFVMDLLLKNIGAIHIVVGYDYCFGAGRGGGVNVLSWLSMQEQFGLTVVKKVMDEDHTYSSSSIRTIIGSGDVRKAAQRLGHWWHIEGRVSKGDQRGRTIDFPTANLLLDVEFVDFIREEMKFDGLETLKNQIERDCVVARELLAKQENLQSFIPTPKLVDHLT